MFFRFHIFQGPRFLGSRFFRIQAFQGPGFSGSSSRVRVQVLEVAILEVVENVEVRKWHRVWTYRASVC